MVMTKKIIMTFRECSFECRILRTLYVESTALGGGWKAEMEKLMFRMRILYAIGFSRCHLDHIHSYCHLTHFIIIHLEPFAEAGTRDESA